MENSKLAAFATAAHDEVQSVIANVETVLRGKRDVVELVLTAMVAGGHVLLDDVPGVGKTVLAKALAASFESPWRRVQFTPDLFPGDITGVSIWNALENQFVFQPGPAFTHLLLCDEVNRAPEKAQSALLEAMEERQVTVDGKPRPLPEPFFVIATQNPFEHRGTYALPESQLDRFLVRLSMGYPDRNSAAEMLAADGADSGLSQLRPVSSMARLAKMIAAARRVLVAEQVNYFIVDLVESTRRHPDIRLGASPRAAVSLRRAAQAQAFVSGRTFVTPDDVVQVVVPVLSHRVHVHDDVDTPSSTLVYDVTRTVPAPNNETH